MKVNSSTYKPPPDTGGDSDDDPRREGDQRYVRGISNPPMRREPESHSGYAPSDEERYPVEIRPRQAETMDFFRSMESVNYKEDGQTYILEAEYAVGAYSDAEVEGDSNLSREWHVESSANMIGPTATNQATVNLERQQPTRFLRAQISDCKLRGTSNPRHEGPKKGSHMRWDCEFHRAAFKILRTKILCPQHRTKVCSYVADGVGNNCFRFICKESKRSFSMCEPQAVEACEANFDDLLEIRPEFFTGYARRWSPPLPALNPREKVTPYSVSAGRALKFAGTSRRRKRLLRSSPLGDESGSEASREEKDGGMWLSSTEVYRMRQEVAKMPIVMGEEVKRLEQAICRLADENQQLLLWRRENAIPVPQPEAIEQLISIGPANTLDKSVQNRIDQAVTTVEGWLNKQEGINKIQNEETVALKARVEALETQNSALSDEVKGLRSELGNLHKIVEGIQRSQADLHQTVQSQGQSNLMVAHTTALMQNDAETRVPRLEGYMQQAAEAIQFLVGKVCNIDGMMSQGSKDVSGMFSDLMNEIKIVSRKVDDPIIIVHQEENCHGNRSQERDLDCSDVEMGAMSPLSTMENKILALERVVMDLCKVCVPTHKYIAEVTFPDEGAITKPIHRGELEEAVKSMVQQDQLIAIIGEIYSNLEKRMADQSTMITNGKEALIANVRDLVKSTEEAFRINDKTWTGIVAKMGEEMEAQKSKTLEIEARMEKLPQTLSSTEKWTEITTSVTAMNAKMVELSRKVESPTKSVQTLEALTQAVQHLAGRMNESDRWREGEQSRTEKSARECLMKSPLTGRISHLEERMGKVQVKTPEMVKKVQGSQEITKSSIAKVTETKIPETMPTRSITILRKEEVRKVIPDQAPKGKSNPKGSPPPKQGENPTSARKEDLNQTKAAPAIAVVKPMESPKGETNGQQSTMTGTKPTRDAQSAPCSMAETVRTARDKALSRSKDDVAITTKSAAGGVKPQSHGDLKDLSQINRHAPTDKEGANTWTILMNGKKYQISEEQEWILHQRERIMQIAMDSITRPRQEVRPAPLTPREGIPTKRASLTSGSSKGKKSAKDLKPEDLKAKAKRSEPAPKGPSPAGVPKAKAAEATATSNKKEEEKARRERASAALKGATNPMIVKEIAARATNKLATIFVPSIVKMHPKECYSLLKDIQITRGKLRVVKFTSSEKGCELLVQPDKEKEVRGLLEAAGLQPAPKGKGWSERILGSVKIEIISKEVKETEMFLKNLAPECTDVREYLAERLTLLHQKVTALDRAGGVSLETASMLD